MYLDCKTQLTLDEACDLNELLAAKVENEHRAHEAAERKAKEKK